MVASVTPLQVRTELNLLKSEDLVPDEVIEAKIATAQLFVDNEISEGATQAKENAAVLHTAVWLTFMNYSVNFTLATIKPVPGGTMYLETLNRVAIIARGIAAAGKQALTDVAMTTFDPADANTSLKEARF